MASIILHNLDFHYDSPYMDVFRHVDLSINLRWRTALIGLNGCGKTTLLRLINSDLVPTAGVITVPAGISYFPFEPSSPKESCLNVIMDCVGPFRAWEKQMAELAEFNDQVRMVQSAEMAEQFKEAGG